MIITFSKAAFAAKPDGATIAALQMQDAYATYETDDVTKIAAMIEQGHAFRACNHASGRTFSERNATETYIIALDFDDVVATPEEYAEKAELAGIMPNLYYYSYSHGIKTPDKNRFRFVWLLDKGISAADARKILLALMAYYPDCDPSCKNPSRLWFATRLPVKVLEEMPTSPAAFAALTVGQKMASGKDANKIVKETNTAEWLEEYCGDAETLDVSYNGDWRERLKLVCPLWRKWCDGDYLPYNLRLLLFSNLKYLHITDTGHTMTELIMEYYNEKTYLTHTCSRQQIAGMMRPNGLKPFRCCCGNANTVVEYLKGGRVIKNPIKKITLAELEELMAAQLPEAFNNNQTMYIQIQTAAGKTKYFIDWVAKTDKRKVIYAAPTYNLLNETKENLFMRGVEMRVPPKANYNNIEMAMLNNGIQPHHYNAERKSVIMDIKDPKIGGIFGVTHELLTKLGDLDKCGIDTIVIDENIEDIIVDEIEVTESRLRSLEPYCSDWNEKALDIFDEPKNKKVNAKPIQDIVANCDILHYTLEGRPSLERIGLIAKGEWEAHATATSSIRFTRRSHIFDYKVPIKMMTATPLRTELKATLGAALGAELTFPLASNKGKVKQFLGVTGAKGYNCDKVPSLIDYVKNSLTEEERKDAYVLSFKAAAQLWKDAGFQTYDIDGAPVHLQNNAGLNGLRGKTVIVAGKYDMPAQWYINKYYDFVNPATNDEPTRSMHKENFNGVPCRIFTWDDPNLKNINCERYGFYLEQATGRARALREPANVYVFANYPIATADEYVY